MGDVAMTEPVLRSLRDRYPQARIVVLTNPFFKPFFREIADVEFFAPDFRERHKGFGGILRLSRDLGKFELVADLHNVIRSKILRRALFFKGAKVAHIDKGRKEKKALVRLKDKKKIPLKPTIERYREVFLRLGLDLPPIVPPARVHYPLDAATAALAGEHTGWWIGIAPFAQHRGKIYPVEKTEILIRKLAQRSDIRIFLFGGGREEHTFAEKMAGETDHVISVIGRIGLDQELDLISNLDLMVSMDSSAMHMASLMGVPVVSVWGATHPYAGFYGLGQDPGNAVQVDLPCRPCAIYGNKPCAIGDYPCMQQIVPEVILEHILHAMRKIKPQ